MSAKYLDPRTLDRIRKLDVRARQVVEGFMTGQHQSPYNGFAVEFASHREYVAGDDIRHIDWKVWSKTDRFFIKEYEEETNLKCHILLDASKSMRYGEAAGWSKFDYAATAAASLAYMLQQQQDAVGLVTFDRKIKQHLPPSSHPSHLRLMLHELEKTSPDEGTDVSEIFPQLAQRLQRRGLIVLISDLFADLGTIRDAFNKFKIRKHEVILLHVMHEDELTFPFDNNTKFRGLETTSQLLTDPRTLKESYLEEVNKFLEKVRALCTTSGVDYVKLSTATPLDAALGGYLAFRQKTQRKFRRR